MFPTNKNKPAFGIATTSPLNIGRNLPTNQIPFGRSPPFGSPASSFGTSPPLFTSTPPKPRSVFSNSNRAAQQPGYGTNLFNPQRNANASGSPFGFVQQNKNFEFAFGIAPTATLVERGSPVKFSPTMATDIISQKGGDCTINAKINNIVCMKEYEKKSQEELRLEDYEDNRKGPQQSTVSPVPTFTNSPVSPYFGQTENKTYFGQSNNSQIFENKPTFGQNNQPGFGQAENKLFGQSANFAGQPNGSFGLSTPPAKPFGFAAACSTFGAAASDKPFAFTATNPTFAAKPFGSLPVQSSASATSPSQPLMFGNTAFDQRNTQTPNMGLYNKPSHPAFNFTQPGQTNLQTNLFQSPKVTTNFPSFGKPDTAVNLLSFGRPASSISLSSTGKTEVANFNFGQLAYVPQPVQNPFGAMQNSIQLTSGQPMPSAFGTEMQSLTNNFMSLHKPIEGNSSLVGPGYGFVPLQQPQLVSSFESKEPENFYNIVDKVYESFPYRSVFDGISVKLYMDEDTTNPRMLNKIMEEEPLPTTAVGKNVKLRMLTGPERRPNINPGKYKWLDGADGTPRNYNNFVLTKKSTKRLTLPKDQSTREKLLHKFLPYITDGDVHDHILEQLNTDTKVSIENVSATNQNLEPTSPEDAAFTCNEEEKAESLTKELLSLVTKQFSENCKDFPRQDDCNNNGILALPKTPPCNENVEQNFGRKSTPLSTKTHTSDSGGKSNEETLASSILPSIKSSLTALLIKDGDFKTDLKAILFADRLHNILKHYEISIEANELSGMGDTATGILPVLDACGIKLTRKDYYTIPPLEELHKYKSRAGGCFVKGFTVGRHGFGSVYFPDEIDVSNLDLDEIIHFHFHEATVYPDNDGKPQLGQGLNRPGQVTLERVWPRHPVTRKILRNPEDIEAENFVERLILLSRRQDAVFVDYRPDTGSWVFRVEHFSKFNFTESDDEELAKELAAKREQEIEEKKKRREQDTRKDLGGEMSHNSNFQKNMFRRSLSQEKLSSILTDDTRNFMVLKYSFFDESTSKCVPNTDPQIGWNMPMNPLDVSTNRSVCGARKKTIMCSPKYVALFNPTRVVPKEKSLIISITRNCMDAGLFKGNSFKTCWGPGFSFTTGGGSASDFYPYLMNEVYQADASKTVKYLKLGDLFNNPQMMDLIKHLNVVFAESTVTFQNYQTPLFTINENLRSLIRHQNVAESFDMNFSMNLSHYRQVWDLCLTLWGPEATTPTNRGTLFNKWLEDATFSFVQAELKDSTTIANIFIYLTGHKITEATELADELGLPYLSILISQASGQESSKELIQHQLEQWKNISIINEMDKDIVKIYMLLGGIPYLCGINVCEGLDWKRTLGVYFWYIYPAGASLNNALEAYHSAFMSGFASPPMPEDYECINSRVYDVLYQIMMLFAAPTTRLEKIVNPIMYTEDALDYRLSWFLLQAFTALKIGTVSQQVTNYVHVSFSSQLEHLGLWEWSVYVLLFIKDESYKANAIMDILERHLDPDSSSKQNTTAQDFLINNLKVPSKWIHSILANKSKVVGNYLETYRHLMLAENWVEAGKVAIEQLIPDFVLNRQWEDLCNLLKPLIPRKRDILRWDTEVGLVLDYMEFNQGIASNVDGFTELQMGQLRGKLAEICFRIGDFPTISPKLKIATAELSSSLIGLLKLLYCQLQPVNETNVNSVIGLVQGLPIPPDYKRSVLQEMCSLVVKN